MKIAFVMMESIYPQRGGIHEQVYLISRELRKKGIDVDIVPYSKRKADEKGKRLLWLREISPTFIKRIVDGKYDVIISETAWPVIPSLVSSRMLRVPCFIHLHSVESRQDTGLSSFGKRIVSILERIGEICDVTFVPSETERTILKKAKILPNVIDVEAFSNAKPVELKKPAVVFVGGMSYPPNKEAALSVIKISKIIRAKGKDANFYLVGPSPPSVEPPVHATGYVESTAPYIKAADICIAPLKRGGGVKLKTLEYMASGKPIIASKIAVEGIEKINYVNAESEEEFATRILDILENKIDLDFMKH